MNSKNDTRSCLVTFLVISFTILFLAGRTYGWPSTTQHKGAEIEPEVTEYENTTDIEVDKGSSSDDNIFLEGGIAGIFSGSSTLATFSNSEDNTISAAGTAGNGTSDYTGVSYVAGVYISDGYTSSFSNAGTISASATAGNASCTYTSPDYDVLYLGSIYGVYSDVLSGDSSFTTGDFINSGIITANTTMGDSQGDSSYAVLASTGGVYIDNSGPNTNNPFYASMGSFTNEDGAEIQVTATAGDAGEENSQVVIAGTSDVFGVYIDNYVYSGSGDTVYASTGDFTNAGSIGVDVTTGDAGGAASSNSIEYNIYGAAINNGLCLYGTADSAYVSTGDISNSGLIEVNVDMGGATGDDSTVETDGGITGVDIQVNSTSSDANSAPVTVGDFDNSGQITVSAEADNAEGTSSLVSMRNLWGLGIGVNSFNAFEGDSGSATMGSFTNSGSVTTDSVVGNAAGENSRSSISGEYGVIISTSSSLYGMHSLAGKSGSASAGTFTNTAGGTIEVSARAGDASGSGSYVSTENLYAVSTGAYSQSEYSSVSSDSVGSVTVGDFINAGTISATTQTGSATGDASTIYATNIKGVSFWGRIYGWPGSESSSLSMGSFTNSGSITADVSTGLDAVSIGDISINGVYGAYIQATATDSGSTGDITNTSTGDILVNIQAGEAQSVSILNASGLYFYSNCDETGDIVNAGDIDVTINSGANSVLGSINGISSRGAGSNNPSLNNSGNVDLSVTLGDDSSTSYLGGIYVNSSSTTVNNSGNIDVSLTAGDNLSITDAVAGIYVRNSADVTLNNSGTINLSCSDSTANVRALYLAGSGVTLSDKYSVVFGNGLVEEPVYVDASSTLNLNDAELVALKGTSLSCDTPHYVIENDGTVEGTFSTLTKDFINEDIIVGWYDDNRGENAAVMFSYKPQSSLPGIGASASTLLVSNSLKGFLTNLEHEHNFPVYGKRSGRIMLAMDENTDTATDSPKNLFTEEPDNGFFVYPYYSRMEDSGIGFDADQYGLMFGLEHKLDEQYAVGLLGGVGQESIKYNTGSGDDKDKPEIYSLGGYLNYSPKPWFFEAALLGYMADHDYEGKTGYNYEIRENAGYWSSGLESELKAGYIFESEDLTITPEAGLNYSYWNVENFRTSATDSSWNRYYQGADEDSLTAIAGISGLKTAKLDDSTKFDLLLGFHVEQSLKGNSFSMDQSIPGLGSNIVSAKQDIGDTTFVGNIAANFTLKDNKFINLSFRNAANADYRSYAAKLSVGFKF